MQIEVKQNIHVSDSSAVSRSVYKRYLKRPMDFILSFIALIVLSPVLIFTAFLIHGKLGSPVIFKQKRPGLNGKIFTLYKFRSMTDEKDDNGNLMADEVRLTKFGKILRSTSLDELPELFNILKGDMSVIGPRPLLIKDLVFFNEDQMKRQSVLPGLSGLAQVNGRNCVLWEDKFKYDLMYIQKITFLGDWKLIFQTIIKVFRKEGIHSEGMATAEDFGDYLLRAGKTSQAQYDAGQAKAKELLKL
ncbi:sugar transferase [Desulfosporosinus sp. FKA]|uniref:sugar transferase n=1 Tax=Desulfosporosinus sp. FKA TaxID=1969834 RepID=UPI001A9A463D|nr:sugar transferase [Desulfosporosinus sp. FKA]